MGDGGWFWGCWMVVSVEGLIHPVEEASNNDDDDASVVVECGRRTMRATF